MNPAMERSRLQAWGDVLTQVQQAIGQALGALDQWERNRGEAAPAGEAQASGLPQISEAVQQFQQRQAGLGACAERASQTAAQVDAALVESEEDLRLDLAATAGVRQRLAEWPGRAVG